MGGISGINGMSTESIIFIVIIAICVASIVVCLIRKRPDLIVNFLLRSCIGVVGIYIFDTILKMKGIDISVGINAATVLTNGILGIPGFLMLYGLAMYYAFG